MVGKLGRVFDQIIRQRFLVFRFQFRVVAKVIVKICHQLLP